MKLLWKIILWYDIIVIIGTVFPLKKNVMFSRYPLFYWNIVFADAHPTKSFWTIATIFSNKCVVWILEITLTVSSIMQWYSCIGFDKSLYQNGFYLLEFRLTIVTKILLNQWVLKIFASTYLTDFLGNK